MKAIVLEKYGAPLEVLQIKEVDNPVPKDDEALIRVHSTAINDWEWNMVRGKPRVYRLFMGIGKPKWPIPGMEFSGTIEALGSKVTTVKVGDAVFGDTSDFGFGTFAEFVCVNQKALSFKPTAMSFKEAASIPHASMLAYQGLIDEGGIKEGMKILINGAGGGVGTFGFQIAKQFNAEVTGVDSGEKLNMMQTLGFDHIIDYKKEDFTRNGKHYDLILDAKSTRSPFAYASLLKPAGTYATVGGTPGILLQLSTVGKLVNWFTKKKIKIVMLKPNKDLSYINQLYLEGKLKCIIDGPYSFDEIPKMIQYFGEGKHSGKVVVSLMNE